MHGLISGEAFCSFFFDALFLFWSRVSHREMCIPYLVRDDMHVSISNMFRRYRVLED